jgi:aspartate/methionine/tyrosine aminotransferase
MRHDALFADDRVEMALLRQRSFNLRWATLPPDVLALTAAEPDFPVAPEIRDAVAAYVRGGVLSYGPPEGLPEFRAVVAQTMRERRGISCTERQVLATDGAASAMFIVARFALKPGDEALIFDPVDFLFARSVEAAGARAVRCRIDPETRALDLEALRRLITTRTRLIGLCNPHNPLGRVLTRAELQAIGALAVEHGLWILADEIWSDIVFAPGEHVSIASLGPEIARRTITVYGFSKSFGLAGPRVGFLVAPEQSFEALLEVSRARTTAYGVSTLSQVAAIAAFQESWYWVEAFVEHLTRARDFAVERLNGMPGERCVAPEGTYVLFPEIRALGMTSAAMAEYLLKEARVAVVPGEARWFGPGAEGHIRLCFSTSLGILREALDRIEAALQRL